MGFATIARGSGDIGVFENTPAVSEICLSDSNCTGKVLSTILNKNTSLLIILSTCSLGDIGILTHCSNLAIFFANCNEITGKHYVGAHFSR